MFQPPKRIRIYEQMMTKKEPTLYPKRNGLRPTRNLLFYDNNSIILTKKKTLLFYIKNWTTSFIKRKFGLHLYLSDCKDN